MKLFVVNVGCPTPEGPGSGTLCQVSHQQGMHLEVCSLKGIELEQMKGFMMGRSHLPTLPIYSNSSVIESFLTFLSIQSTCDDSNAFSAMGNDLV